MDSIQSLPRDLQPEAVGLSRDLVKQCHTEESVDVSSLLINSDYTVVYGRYCTEVYVDISVFH